MRRLGSAQAPSLHHPRPAPEQLLAPPAGSRGPLAPQQSASGAVASAAKAAAADSSVEAANAATIVGLAGAECSGLHPAAAPQRPGAVPVPAQQALQCSGPPPVPRAAATAVDSKAAVAEAPAAAAFAQVRPETTAAHPELCSGSSSLVARMVAFRGRAAAAAGASKAAGATAAAAAAAGTPCASVHEEKISAAALDGEALAAASVGHDGGCIPRQPLSGQTVLPRIWAGEQRQAPQQRQVPPQHSEAQAPAQELSLRGWVGGAPAEAGPQPPAAGAEAAAVLVSDAAAALSSPQQRTSGKARGPGPDAELPASAGTLPRLQESASFEAGAGDAVARTAAGGLTSRADATTAPGSVSSQTELFL